MTTPLSILAQPTLSNEIALQALDALDKTQSSAWGRSFKTLVLEQYHQLCHNSLPTHEEEMILWATTHFNEHPIQRMASIAAAMQKIFSQTEGNLQKRITEEAAEVKHQKQERSKLEDKISKLEVQLSIAEITVKRLGERTFPLYQAPFFPYSNL